MSCVLAYIDIIGGFHIHLVNWEGTFTNQASFDRAQTTYN